MGHAEKEKTALCNRTEHLVERSPFHQNGLPQKPRVLVIGRYSGHHRLIHLALEDEYEVGHAYSGFLALTLLREQPFDLVISAVDLPREFSGRRMLKAVRALPGYEHLPVIGLVSEEQAAPSEGAKKYRSQGFSDCIINPDGFETVRTVVKGLLGTRKRNAA